MIDLSTVLPNDPRVMFRDADVMLIHSRWQDVIGDLPVVDAVITDPPYSARVHSWQRKSRPRGGGGRKTTLSYDGVDREWVCDAARSWHTAARWWVVVFSDHSARLWWESSLREAGAYVFAPVIWLRECATPRLGGDGPTSACDYITVSRPRQRLPAERCGSRPGLYLFPGNDQHDNSHPGGKPIKPMLALVSDYSREGDLILDPCAGGATTAVAAKQLGRQCIAIEMDADTCAKAAKRLAGVRRQMPLWKPDAQNAKQEGLDL